jgi:hypothetical protein
MLPTHTRTLPTCARCPPWICPLYSCLPVARRGAAACAFRRMPGVALSMCTRAYVWPFPSSLAFAWHCLAFAWPMHGLCLAVRGHYVVFACPLPLLASSALPCLALPYRPACKPCRLACRPCRLACRPCRLACRPCRLACRPCQPCMPTLPSYQLPMPPAGACRRLSRLAARRPPSRMRCSTAKMRRRRVVLYTASCHAHARGADPAFCQRHRECNAETAIREHEGRCPCGLKAFDALAPVVLPT